MKCSNTSVKTTFQTQTVPTSVRTQPCRYCRASLQHTDHRILECEMSKSLKGQLADDDFRSGAFDAYRGCTRSGRGAMIPILSREAFFLVKLNGVQVDEGNGRSEKTHATIHNDDATQRLGGLTSTRMAAAHVARQHCYHLCATEDMTATRKTAKMLRLGGSKDDDPPTKPHRSSLLQEQTR